jgi:hypothetical protein
MRPAAGMGWAHSIGGGSVFATHRVTGESKVTEDSHSVYQTGQKAPRSGTYAVVGVKPTTQQKPESAIRCLNLDDVFPSYEGWEVCWHFLSAELESTFENHRTDD